MSSGPLYTSSHLNSGVYVVVRVFTPRLQTKTLPYSLSVFFWPFGYLALNWSNERTLAVPLIVVNGLSSNVAVM